MDLSRPRINRNTLEAAAAVVGGGSDPGSDPSQLIPSTVFWFELGLFFAKIFFKSTDALFNKFNFTKKKQTP